MNAFWQDLKYAKEVVFHPFDTFYELKFRGKGNLFVALLFFVLLGVVNVIGAEFSGFLVTFVKKSEMNSIIYFVGILLPYILFAIGNYAVTTLMDGKGRLDEIFVVIGYSLIPNFILMFIATIVSNFITADEIAFIGIMILIGNGISFFLIFVGLIVTHEYTFFRNIVSIILSFIAVGIIIFLLLLMITLFSQLYAFIKIVITEIRN